MCEKCIEADKMLPGIPPLVALLNSERTQEDLEAAAQAINEPFELEGEIRTHEHVWTAEELDNTPLPDILVMIVMRLATIQHIFDGKPQSMIVGEWAGRILEVEMERHLPEILGMLGGDDALLRALMGESGPLH